MRKSLNYALVLGLLLTFTFGSMAFAQSSTKAENPCNPCAGKKAMNPCNACSYAAKFYVDDGRNVLTFESKAPLEKIIGTTAAVKGHVYFDPEDITNKPMGKFEVDLASLKTGIGLRDSHMRDQYLETGEHPKAILTLGKVLKASSKKLQDQKPVTADIEATLELHGVKQKLTLKGVKVTHFKESEATRARLPGNLIHIEADFSVKLPDYQIKVPKMVVLKLDENIKISVDVFGNDVPPKEAMAENPCNPCSAGKAANPCNPCG